MTIYPNGFTNFQGDRARLSGVVELQGELREKLKKEMVDEYLATVTTMIHPSQLMYWAEKALQQGVRLQDVRTEE
jgi:hypothetical protein